jgi:putative membrane protein
MNRSKLSAILACCIALLVTLGTTAGQDQSPLGQAPRANPNPPASSPGDTFLNKAIESNSAEVQLGKLAATKSQNPKVKTYADMLVKDHTAALTKLQKLQPGDVNVALSTEHEKLMMRLSGLSGGEFDREYMDAMVNGHREAVKLFEQQIGSTARGTNTDVNNVARELLPTIKHHLQQGEQIQSSLTQQAR